MSQAEQLIGDWWGGLQFNGQDRALAIRVTAGAAGALEGAWRMVPASDFSPIEVRPTDQGVAFASPQLTFIHRGPIGERLAGMVTSGNSVDATELSFWLSRDQTGYLACARPRVDAAGRLITADEAPTPPAAGIDWPVAKPTGTDRDRVAQMIAEVLVEPRQITDGFLVVQDGVILVEEYFYGTARDQLHPLASVTKSVTGLLCGIALARGDFPDLDTPVMDLYPDYADRLWARERYPITVRHLLTMSAGIEWDEGSTNYGHARNSHTFMNQSDDWVGYVFDRPLVKPPGSLLNYCSGLSIVLGDILARRAGDVAAYAEAHLFGPIGIDRYMWQRIRSGRHQTGGGLALRLRDMARLGQLMLQQGAWEGRQVVPADWVRDSMTIHARSPVSRYGYQWWLGPSDATRPDQVTAWSALGHGGQRIHILPQQRAIIAHTGSDYGGGGPELDRRLGQLLLPIVGRAPGAASDDA